MLGTRKDENICDKQSAIVAVYFASGVLVRLW